ncbi:MAG: LysM peptidoglycan-binding domain-containing protein [Ilumatobacter sp.]|uniref:LysM peptidoglycan-binding domain-containing protein n=1 Tax=Ilumatobacter sp. TaxID=1967498 RepID=UPI00391BDBF5
MNESRSFTRALIWLAVSAAFLAAFVVAGRWSISPLDFPQVGTWLDGTEPIDAFVEVARWIGIVLAGYVVAVSLLVLASEAAAAARLVSVSRLLSRTSHACAVPIIRKRLVEASAATAMTASLVSLSAGGLVSATGSVPTNTTAQSIDSTSEQSTIDVEGAVSGVEDADVVVVTVKRGDTLVKLARVQYGEVTDRTTVDWLADVNDLADANLIFPGQQLKFPPLGSQTPPPPVATDASWTTYTTARGDTLWEIIEVQYGAVNADMVWTVSELNQLDNPSEIAIGMQLVLPPMDEDGMLITDQVTPPAPRAPIEVPDVVDEVIPEFGDAPVEDFEAVAVDVVEPVAEAEVDASEVESRSFPPPTDSPLAPVPTDVPATSVTPAVVVSRSGEVAIDGADVVNEWHRSVWANVAAGSLLLAGLGLAVRRFRLRRLARLGPGERITDPPSVASGTELAITRSPESIAHLTTLRGLMQSLTPYAAEQSDPPAVRAVQIGEDRVEVLFASPAPLPPKGWSTIDGSHSWTHRFDDDPVASRQLLTPALVTIGRRSDDDGDQEVLLDLETAASVAISGDTDAAMGLARSMALELATYPLGVPMDLCLIGLHVDGTEVCDRVWQDTTLQRAVRTTREHVDAMAASGAASMVSARSELAEDDGRHDPIVFIVNAGSVADCDRVLLDELVDICVPSMGVAVVVVGGHANANEQIVIDDASKAVWSHVALTAPMVSLQAAAEAAVMLDHALNAESEPMKPSQIMSVMLAETEAAADHSVEVEPLDVADVELADEIDVDDEVPEFEYVAPTFDVLLRVMGNVRTEGIDLSANDTELLGVLACLRGHASVDLGLVHEAIAPNRERKTVENRVSTLRRRLGVGSNGEDLLPATGPAARFFELSRLVVSDVDLLEHRLHSAHELGSNDARRVLSAGLDLMEGPLFRAQKGFDGWPQSEGVVVAMTTVITNYALMLIDLAVEVDDFALVARTTAAAGQVLDNPVSEFPFRQKEEEYAEACGDDDLVASVDAAREKLLAYLRDEDSLATP